MPSHRPHGHHVTQYGGFGCGPLSVSRIPASTLAPDGFCDPRPRSEQCPRRMACLQQSFAILTNYLEQAGSSPFLSGPFAHLSQPLHRTNTLAENGAKCQGHASRGCWRAEQHPNNITRPTITSGKAATSFGAGSSCRHDRLPHRMAPTSIVLQVSLWHNHVYVRGWQQMLAFRCAWSSSTSRWPS